MARKKKTEEIEITETVENTEVTETQPESQEDEFSDDYFINLTMDYDKRDDEIYPKWAVWCAKSNDKYYIDGKDGHFYTHRRSNTEIAIERKRRDITEFVMCQERPINQDGNLDESWIAYEEYINEMMADDDKILEAKPLSYCDWLVVQAEDEEALDHSDEE